MKCWICKKTVNYDQSTRRLVYANTRKKYVRVCRGCAEGIDKRFASRVK